MNIDGSKITIASASFRLCVMVGLFSIVIGGAATVMVGINPVLPFVFIIGTTVLFLALHNPFAVLCLFVASRVLVGPIEENFTLIPGVVSLGGTLNIVIAALFLVVLIQESLGKIGATQKLRMTPYFTLYVSYLVFFGITSIISPDPIWSIKLFSRSLSYFLIFLLTIILVDSKKKLITLFNVLKFTLLVSLVGSALQIVFGWGIPVSVDVAYPRYTSMFFLHPNDYANYLGYLFFPIFCVWYYTNRRLFSFDFILIGLSLIGIIGTYSRAVWVSFGLGALLLFLMVKQNLRFIVKMVMVGLVVGVIFWQPMLVRMSEVPIVKKTLDLKSYPLAAEFNTMEERLARWKQVIDLSKEGGLGSILLGHGTGSVRDTFQWSSHNNYIDIFYDNGAIVLALYLMLLILLVKTLLLGSFRCTDGLQRGLLLGVSLSIIVMLITGLAESNRGYTMQQLYFWVVVGLGVALVRLRREWSGAAKHNRLAG